ncbi:DivIVA domain-containing protein [Brachybacterium saurashtrense]|uniref:DivIVA domain-containing protein n=1 Tax=Brachybacterium saurashtrense TaxID=556288 RepID=A0A345YT80_9MICO|nr:DivIVA domain-containing protein [Brachybacterium saurashtrense]AXK47132.1 DivIVA domain-containing protein [Brachybacterium saurashtrense]RRR23454.1 DivIVA domain-containing protein [Brachybacterium saurashtrense]
MDARFTRTRFAPGYRTEEVDRFIARCERALAARDGSVTADEVMLHRFTEARFEKGYSMDEVDRYLDTMIPTLRAAEEGRAPAAGVPASLGAPPTGAQAAAEGGAMDAARRLGARAAHPAGQRPGLLARLVGSGR